MKQTKAPSENASDSPQVHFQAVLEEDQTALRWVIVRVPVDPVTTWPSRNGMRVRGTISSATQGSDAPQASFRTSIFGTPDRGYILLINKQMQKTAKIAVGSLAAITLEPDLEERAAPVPPELASLLKQDRSLRHFYQELPYSARKDIADHIAEPKSPESRNKRAEQLAERMMLAMEGERELPPILQIAFRSQPQAAAGWQAMTPVQRRSHLMGIFGYQSPESRNKRAQKAVDEALKIARKNV